MRVTGSHDTDVLLVEEKPLMETSHEIAEDSHRKINLAGAEPGSGVGYRNGNAFYTRCRCMFLQVCCEPW